jgi:hypothetical protein
VGIATPCRAGQGAAQYNPADLGVYDLDTAPPPLALSHAALVSDNGTSDQGYDYEGASASTPSVTNSVSA